MFTGRISVRDYWKSVLLLLLLYILVGLAILVFFIFTGAAFFAHLSGASVPSLIGSAIFFLAIALIPIAILAGVTFVAVVGLQIRRLHDLGLTGWIVLGLWVASTLIVAFGRTGGDVGSPFYSPWALLLLTLLSIFNFGITLWPGKAEPNSYGEWMRYRSWWAALVGDKNPVSTGSHKSWIIGLVILLALIGGGFVYVFSTTKTSGTTTTPSAAGPAVTNSLLASAVFVTPSGTPIIQPPAGWGNDPVDEYGTHTQVIFTDPNSSAILAVNIDPTDTDTTAQQSLEKSFAQEGGTPAPTVIAEAPVTIGNASGYMIEGTFNWALVDGKFQNGTVTHALMYELVDGSTSYFIDANAPQSDWLAALPAFSASIPTLQTP